MLYVVTGASAVGKTTVCDLLAGRYPLSACVDGDFLYHFVSGGYVPPWREGNHLPVFWDNCLSVLGNFLSRGYVTVFHYVVYPQDLQRIRAAFPEEAIKFALLTVDEATLAARNRARPADIRTDEALSLQLLRDFAAMPYEGRFRLDSQNLTPAQTAGLLQSDSRFTLPPISFN
jgi:hypothetical protein